MGSPFVHEHADTVRIANSLMEFHSLKARQQSHQHPCSILPFPSGNLFRWRWGLFFKCDSYAEKENRIMLMQQSIIPFPSVSAASLSPTSETHRTICQPPPSLCFFSLVIPRHYRYLSYVVPVLFGYASPTVQLANLHRGIGVSESERCGFELCD